MRNETQVCDGILARKLAKSGGHAQLNKYTQDKLVYFPPKNVYSKGGGRGAIAPAKFAKQLFGIPVCRVSHTRRDVNFSVLILASRNEPSGHLNVRTFLMGNERRFRPRVNPLVKTDCTLCRSKRRVIREITRVRSLKTKRKKSPGRCNDFQ